MSVLYLTEQGSTVIKRDGRLIVLKGKETLCDLPLEKIEQVIIMGNVHVTTPAIGHFLREGIDVAYLSSQGAYRGRLQPERNNNILLRQAQYRKCADARWALPIAQAIVAGKIRNSLVLLQRQRRSDTKVQTTMQRLTDLEHAVHTASNMNAVCGYEGAAAALYYKAFATFLPDSFPFAQRQHHPSPDPINALLSFGYTLLYNNLISACSIVGLDPYLGCFHQPQEGHACLASDLVEEFRAVIVDSLVLMMLNHRELMPQDFTRQENKCLMNRQAMRKFLTRYDQRINTQAHYHAMEKRFTYRQFFELQARQFAHAVLGKRTDYEAYQWRW